MICFSQMYRYHTLFYQITLHMITRKYSYYLKYLHDHNYRVLLVVMDPGLRVQLVMMANGLPVVMD